ncbi:mesoderm induction early response protein 1-like [Glandiceps talaboti]
MMINDFDDERTMEEEEQLSGSSCGNEIDDLEKESEMPLEDLLAMYGYGGEAEPQTLASVGEDEDDNIQINTDNLTLDKEQIADLLPDDPDENGESSNHEELTSDMYVLMGESPEHSGKRPLRSNTMADSGSESDDSDYVPPPYDDWKKEIKIGSYFQAEVPEGLSKYDDAPAYENEDRLLWDPSKCNDDRVEEYLRHVQEIPAGTQGVKAIPTGDHVRDDEQALYLLLQCGNNLDEALRRHKMQVTPPTDEMSLWSEEECRSFENGLRTYGKDFHMIQQHKVRTRSVGELVQFYYLWKKTERHDAFANQARLSKPKYKIHPGITDYMDRFIDDSEANTSRSVSPHAHLLNRPLFLKPSANHPHHGHHTHHSHMAESSSNLAPVSALASQTMANAAANGHSDIQQNNVAIINKSCVVDGLVSQEQSELEGPSETKRFKPDSEFMFVPASSVNMKSIQHNHVRDSSSHLGEDLRIKPEIDSIRGVGTAAVASINVLPEGLLTSGPITQTSVTSSEPISQ